MVETGDWLRLEFKGEQLEGQPRGPYARDVYTWAHAPIIGGVIAAAAAVEEILLHPSDPLPAAFRTMLERLRDKDITILLEEDAKEFLIEEGYDPAYGARPMRRAVEKHLEDPLAEHLLRGDVKEGDFVTVKRLKDENRLAFSAEEIDPGEPEKISAEEAE